MILEEPNYLIHYGVLRKSGRYPWGSGNNQSSRNRMFLDHVEELTQKGLTEKEIAVGFDISIARLRAAKSIARAEQKQAQITWAQQLSAKGMSNVAIGAKMGLNESSVRALLAPGQKEKAQIIDNVAEMLKEEVDKHGFIDIGVGTENHIGVNSTRLSAAVALLQEQDYEVHTVPVRQVSSGKNTKVKVLARPGSTWGDVMRNQGNIRTIAKTSEDSGMSFNSGIQPPLPISKKRVKVAYAEDGGANADGVIYVRPGVKDISLGNSSYAQVRIQVGSGHYLKGMAMYKDDLPDGVDLLFNTNKSKKDVSNDLDAMKPLSDDPDLPFGAVIKRQQTQSRPDGSQRVTSVMNIVNEEGDWARWNKALSSQMLSKQSPRLAKTQLDLTYERRLKAYEEISALTNPTVRKKLLEQFGDDADSAAVHLKAAALPRQGAHVILPIDSMSPTEIYAPNYKDGEEVVLIRHPHGGTFEIPKLRVNNNHPEAKRLLGDGAKDAVGIHKSVADLLSGADFDGDTVLVIPNNSGKVKTSSPLEGLKNFDPKTLYKAYEGMPRMSPRTKQAEMGFVSNLITDMTIRGASPAELARAVRHSMVVIDAEKHHLNYKQSAIDNGIPALKAKYQGSARSGASTLISRAKSEIRVAERTPRSAARGGAIDKTTGKRVYDPTGATYINGRGVVTQKTSSVYRLADTDDANTLSSGTRMESIYAEHSNKLKTLANRARLESVNTPRAAYSPSANKTYANEVASLNSKLVLALRNAPLERQAQILANQVVKAKRDLNPDLDPEQIKKIKRVAEAEMRARTGAKKHQIVVTQNEWDAIQAGAISDSKLSKILSNADMDVIRDFATPKTNQTMTATKITRARQMLASGAKRSEVAEALGVSVSVLDSAVDEETD